MASEKYMRLDPAYRKLQKLKDLVIKEKASSKISDETEEVMGLMKVSEKLYNYVGHLDEESHEFSIFQNYIDSNFKE